MINPILLLQLVNRSIDTSCFKEQRLAFFAGGGRTSNSSESDEDQEDEEVEEPEVDKGTDKAPPMPPETGEIDQWLEYEKNINKLIKKMEASTEDGVSERRKLRELRAKRLHAKTLIRRKRKDRDAQEAKEAKMDSGALKRPLDHHSTLQKRMSVVRRFLKNSDLLLIPEEREKGADSKFTDWELSILDLHDVDQEINLLYRGRKLYVGSLERDEELQKKADLIVQLEDDLDNDKKLFEANKKHYSDAEVKEKKRQFIEREQRIEGLRRAKEQEMYIQINQYIDELEEKRHQKKLKVLKKMVDEFERRINDLTKAWQDPPEQFKHNQEEGLRLLSNMSKVLVEVAPLLKIKNKFLRHKRLLNEAGINDYLDEDLKAMRAFDMQLDACEMRSNAKARQIEPSVEEVEAPPIDELAQSFENWESRREKISGDIGFISENKEPVLEALRGVRKMVESAPLVDFTGETDEARAADKEARLEMIDQNIERVSGDDTNEAAFDGSFGTASGRMKKLYDDVVKSDPESPATKEKKRTLKEAIDQSNKYFDEVSRFRGDLDSLKDNLKAYSENKAQTDQVRAESNAIDVSVRWLTGADVVRIWEKFAEWSKRRWDRKSDDRIGEVGSKLFDIPGISITKSLANEFDKVRESAETGEVSQYKEALDNKDAWQIEDVMASTKNVDELKACLTSLSEKGRLRFDNPDLWRQLEFFQGTIKICENYDDESQVMWLQDHPMELHDRIHKAMGYIWDFDTYYDFKNQQDNNYESGKGNWTKRLNEISEVDGGLDKRARQILTEYKNDKEMGRKARVNPHEFEAIIEYAMKQGKMSPEGKLYYLIQGIDCGLLEYPDRLVYFDSTLLNEFPALEAIASSTGRGGKPTRIDIANWAKLDKEKNEPGDEFVQWFWTLVSHKPRVLQRIDKTLTQGPNRMDHDDVVGAVAFGDANTVKNMLAKSYGGEYGLPQTGFMNVPVAYLQYLDNWALNAKYIDNSVVQLKRMVSAFSMYYSITQEDKRMYKNKDYYRYSEHLKNDPNGPRAAGGYATHKGRGVQTVHQHMEKVKDLLSALDKPLFDKIFDPSIARDANKFKQAIAWMKDYSGDSKLFGAYDPKNYEELIESGLPSMLTSLLKGQKGKERMKAMVSAVKTDIKNTVGDSGLRNFDNIARTSGFDEPLLSGLANKNIDKLPAGV